MNVLAPIIVMCITDLERVDAIKSVDYTKFVYNLSNSSLASGLFGGRHIPRGAARDVVVARDVL